MQCTYYGLSFSSFALMLHIPNASPPFSFATASLTPSEKGEPFLMDGSASDTCNPVAGSCPLGGSTMYKYSKYAAQWVLYSFMTKYKTAICCSDSVHLRGRFGVELLQGSLNKLVVICTWDGPWCPQYISWCTSSFLSSGEFLSKHDKAFITDLIPSKVGSTTLSIVQHLL